LTKKVIILLLALAALVSVCAAQYYTPAQANDNEQGGSVSGGMPEAASATGNASAPTDTRPQAGEQPQTPPETSTGEAASELEQGQSLTQEQVTSFGQVEGPGEAPAAGLVGGIIPSSIQYRILYNGVWSYGPAALGSGQQTNMLVSVDQPQQIWSYEKYPSGYEVWEQWGYWDSGDYNAWFYADAVGWHLVAIYGDASGWSNAVWIYVVPESPFVANGGPQPISETEGEETETPDVSEIQP
jgi:hypothetical protein